VSRAPKTSANERALVKLYLEWWNSRASEGLTCREERAASFAAYLARRGVLAVCAQTVRSDTAGYGIRLWPTEGWCRANPDRLRAYLRRLARGAP
jgi:hypothetical protein